MIDQTAHLDEQITEMARNARRASRALITLTADDRSRILTAMADGINSQATEIMAANQRDLEAAHAADLPAAMTDRLALDEKRIDAMANGVRTIAGLPDVIGTVLETRKHVNGMTMQKVRVPLGVLAMIYESRPNVTADAAGLCFKAGSAVILRGGSEAQRSNDAIHRAMIDSGCGAGLPEHAVQLVRTTDRAAVGALLKQDQYIDLVIPRGGEALIQRVATESRIPVLKHYKGVCHVFVDRDADLDMAERIVINGKCQRPGVCNAVETLLIHRDIADVFIPRIAAAIMQCGVELRGDADVCMLIPKAHPATENDWREEYLALILAVRVVDDLDAALDHIETYGSRHTDVIVTSDTDAANRFLNEVDSATVYVNASSRFTDGSEFGMGAEIGISTDKLHARGPCGIDELTTYKWIIRGCGQVRE